MEDIERLKIWQVKIVEKSKTHVKMRLKDYRA